MRSHFKFLAKFLAPAVAAIVCFSPAARAQNYKNVGRAPTEQEIQAMDIAVSTEGKELPPGSGTAKIGAQIFADKCAVCHGENQQGSAQAPALVGGKGTLSSMQPKMTAGSYWPFATTIFDYIRRAMPRFQEGTLKADEV